MYILRENISKSEKVGGTNFLTKFSYRRRMSCWSSWRSSFWVIGLQSRALGPFVNAHIRKASNVVHRDVENIGKSRFSQKMSPNAPLFHGEFRFSQGFYTRIAYSRESLRLFRWMRRPRSFRQKSRFHQLSMFHRIYMYFFRYFNPIFSSFRTFYCFVLSSFEIFQIILAQPFCQGISY